MAIKLVGEPYKPEVDEGFGREAAPPPKPQTLCIEDLSKLPAALKPLVKLRRWVVWRNEWEDHDWWMILRQPRDPEQRASNNKPKTWGTFDEAVAVVKAKRADGIAFNFLDSDFGAIHLYQCRAEGVLKPWAQAILDRAPKDTYVEWTTSGNGLSIIGTTIKAALDREVYIGDDGSGGLHRRSAGIMISGMALPGRGTAPLANIDALIDALLGEYDKEYAAKMAREEEPSPKKKRT